MTLFENISVIENRRAEFEKLIEKEQISCTIVVYID